MRGHTEQKKQEVDSLEVTKKKEENNRKKRYLKGYRLHRRRVERIGAEIEEIRSIKMNPSVVNDGMPHGSGGQCDLSGYAADLDQKENELYLEGVERMKSYKDISYRINQLDNEDERDVLFYRYIKGKEFWEIARLMDYSERWIYELHGRALGKLKIS